MDRGKQIDAIARSSEERILLQRVSEKLERARLREMPAASAFLTLQEQALLREVLPGCAFFGGAEGTERAVAFYLPEYLTEAMYFEDGPITCLRGEFYEKNALSHRDVLGALMGAGLRRDAVGDICLREKECDIFVLSEVAPYLLDHLTSAGRHHLSLRRITLAEALVPPKEMKELRVTVSSLRLDSVLSAAFHLCRSGAVEAIRTGKAARNDLVCDKPDRTVAEGDVLSLRGCGKFQILAVNGETRKGRLSVTLGIYV